MSLCEDLTGKRFNKLVVLERVENGKGDKSRWRCLCDCGNETIVSGNNLKAGGVKSCGCLRHAKHNTHHLSNTRLYRIWDAMKNRCYLKTHSAYLYYGGRGITVCDAWKDNFEAFYGWAINNGYSEDLTIDRIDNDSGYSPENCKWSTREEQVNNRKSCVLITYNGETKNLMQWCKLLNLPYKLIHQRMYLKNISFEEAISIPIKSRKK